MSLRPDAHSPYALCCLVCCLANLAACPGCRQTAEDQAAQKTFEIDKQYRRGPVTLRIRIDKKEITIADRLQLELEVRAGEDYEVQLPQFGDKLDQFGIVDYHASPAELGDHDTLVYRKSYVLEPFLSGDYKIPPMKVVFWKREENDQKRPAEKKPAESEAGPDQHEVESEELAIRVKSLLPEKAAELTIKDIAGPVAMPTPSRAWMYWSLAAGLAAVGLLGGLVLWRLRVRRPSEAARRAAHEIAYEQLERLLAENLLEQGRVKEFFEILSDILRRYIENRFGLRAPERTTEEFMEELRSTELLAAAHKGLLEDFLRRCDLVKFARHEPADEEIQQAFDACKRFLVETEPKPAQQEDRIESEAPAQTAAGPERGGMSDAV